MWSQTVIKRATASLVLCTISASAPSLVSNVSMSEIVEGDIVNISCSVNYSSKSQAIVSLYASGQLVQSSTNLTKLSTVVTARRQEPFGPFKCIVTFQPLNDDSRQLATNLQQSESTLTAVEDVLCKLHCKTELLSHFLLWRVYSARSDGAWKIRKVTVKQIVNSGDTLAHLCDGCTLLWWQESMAQGRFIVVLFSDPASNLKLSPDGTLFRPGVSVICIAEGNPAPTYRWLRRTDKRHDEN